MGYTHYWRQRRDILVAPWSEIMQAATCIVEQTKLGGVPLAWESDEPQRAPEITKDAIRFNGVGDDGHETFMLMRKRRKPEYKGDDPAFNFCKTAQKPYDVAVVAILAYVDSLYGELFDVSSDGDPPDWEAGVALARKAVPTKANQIQIPRAVRSEAA